MLKFGDPCNSSDGLAVWSSRSRHEFNAFGHHETGVETEAEVADNRVVFLLVFFQEVFSMRGNLILM